MSRRPPATLVVELPVDPPSVLAARVVLNQGLDASAEANGWFSLAVVAYREWRREAWAGIVPAASATELQVADHATTACMLHLWANPRVRKRFLHPINLHKALTTMVSTSARASPVVWPDLRLAWSRPGRQPGAPTLAARSWDPDKLREEFPEALKRVREHVRREQFRRPRWIELLGDELNMSVATLRRALDSEPTLRQLLNEIAGQVRN